MSEEPYLILHKVRGEPAFDIAIKVQIGAEDETKPGWIEEAWIIPTSGHRAYPWWCCTLHSLTNSFIPNAMEKIMIEGMSINNYPDHYSCNDRPSHEVSAKPSPRPRPQPTVNDLMELLK